MSANTLYTFAKAIDDASSFNGTGGTVVQFLDNRALERGLSTFDVAAQSATQASSFLRQWACAACCAMAAGRRKLLRSWNMNGNFNVTTGTPLTANVSGNLANTGGLAGGGSLRAEATGLPIQAGRSVLQYAGLHHSAGGPVRQCGPDTIPGLFRVTVNSSLNRSFRFAGEPAHADVLGEREQRAQSRDHHQHRDHGELVELRAAGGGVGDPLPDSQFAVQFLRHMRNKSSDLDTSSTLSTVLPVQRAQQTPRRRLRQAAVTFKANSNLVIVDVTAKDKGGLAIEGLKAEDFTVLEDGKPQKVSVFEFQRISSKPEPPPELTLDDQFALPEAPRPPSRRPRPGRFSITTSA